MAAAGFTYHSIGRPAAEPPAGRAPYLRAIA
jgi:hypothetical protein